MSVKQYSNYIWEVAARQMDGRERNVSVGTQGACPESVAKEIATDLNLHAGDAARFARVVWNQSDREFRVVEYGLRVTGAGKVILFDEGGHEISRSYL